MENAIIWQFIFVLKLKRKRMVSRCDHFSRDKELDLNETRPQKKKHFA